MDIKDDRSDEAWGYIANDGIHFDWQHNLLGPGSVVEVQGETGLYLLCQESAHDRGGLQRCFLVELVLGRRRPDTPNRVYIKPVKHELRVS